MVVKFEELSIKLLLFTSYKISRNFTLFCAVIKLLYLLILLVLDILGPKDLWHFQVTTLVIQHSGVWSIPKSYSFTRKHGNNLSIYMNYRDLQPSPFLRRPESQVSKGARSPWLAPHFRPCKPVDPARSRDITASRLPEQTRESCAGWFTTGAHCSVWCSAPGLLAWPIS